MIRIVSGMVLAGLMSLTMAAASQAQERTLRKVTAGQAAPLQNSMTQAQARKSCQQEMAGTRESRSAIRKKMEICMRGRMEGN